MTLVEQIESDYITAFKARDTQKTNTLRLLKSALKNEQINSGNELDDPAAIKVLNKEAKQRKDSIEQFTAGNRPEAAANEQNELTIIESYLPKTMDEAQLARLVETIVGETGATQKSDMGKVMGALKQKLTNPADVSRAATLASQKLT